MKRREFNTLVGVGIGSGVLPLAVTGCQSKIVERSTQAPAVGVDEFETVGTLTELNQTGQLLNEQLAAGKVLVISDPANADNVIAVNPTCPHAACSVAWQAADTAFVCPCHDSRFSADGQVTKGPATEPLATYQAKVEGDRILVNIS